MILKVSSLPGGAAASIDVPKNWDIFTKRVPEQKKEQENKSNVEMPSDVMEAYTKYTSGKYGGPLGQQWAQQLGLPMAAGPTAQVMGNPGGGAKDLTTQLAELEAIKDSGALDDDEFKAAIAQLVGC